MIKTNRPLVTFALFAYNQEKYIREAVAGALAQDYYPLEIIFSDDFSTDKTFEIITEIIKSYTGAHKIILNKNNSNIGIGAHVNKLMSLSSGKIIVGAAGDDVSLSCRVTKLVEKFVELDCRAHSVWSSAKYINGQGDVLQNKFVPAIKHSDVSIIENKNPVIGATHAWLTDVFVYFGPLLPGIVFEDNAISFRSYLLGGIEYVNDNLVLYRQHESNLTNFSRNLSVILTYERAYLRVKAKSIGLTQRLNDLHTFSKKSGVRNDFMVERIKKEIIRNEVLVRVYKDFPLFKINNMHYVLINLEVSKVFLRSLIFKIFGDKFVV